MGDDAFLTAFSEKAAAIPGVVAVALGGSRAQGTAHAGSDWDFAIYYRRSLDPASVRAAGWEGEVFAPGDWGGGVMNGGAFLRVDGRRVDLHYRDLDDVEHWWNEAREGRFEIQRLPFYLAGIPTYTVVAELAIGVTLRGELPRPTYPRALSASASRTWHDAAHLSLQAAAAYAGRAAVAECLGSLARALLEEAHARAAARSRWVLNEKRLLEAAG
ncbi:MAG: nucleotidyltransferase domain-containing protein, partial [Chloroflexota bacterium]|nr:nucleotidyltransferase domain-containing protein [Chloroflexota bacterium]